MRRAPSVRSASTGHPDARRRVLVAGLPKSGKTALIAALNRHMHSQAPIFVEDHAGRNSRLNRFGAIVFMMNASVPSVSATALRLRALHRANQRTKLPVYFIANTMGKQGVVRMAELERLMRLGEGGLATETAFCAGSLASHVPDIASFICRQL